MPDTHAESWSDANQAYLLASLAGLKNQLERHSGAANMAGAKDTHARRPDPSTPVFQGRPPALERVTRVFGLSPFERDVLLLCAGIELLPNFGSLCASVQGAPERAYPTFSMALAALPGAHWSALSPDAPLRRWRLVEVGTGPVLTLAPLRIDERLLHCLAGIRQLDERLAVMVELLGPIDIEALVPSQAEVAGQIASAWAASANNVDVPVVQLCGDLLDCRPIVAAAAQLLGLRGASLPMELVPPGATDLESFLRLWQREAALAGVGVLMIEWDDDAVEGEAIRVRTQAAMRLLERLEGFAVLRSREPRRIAHRMSIVLDVLHPEPGEQRQAWEDALGEAAKSVTGMLDAVAAQFSLSLPAIKAIAAEALARHNDQEQGTSLSTALWDLPRARLRARLEGLAQRIEARVTWNDLVIPDMQTETLRAIAVQLRHRTQVHERWGFAAKSSRGLGISALFSGPSGTGKTMAAEVLGHELRLDLYRIDLSSVVSKYIGETEKNLRRVFDAAEESGAILLFDEADALFGRRSEVKDSHDRYANVEVSYLLQRMEAYRGLAILTTNMKSALDPAFLRRIRFVVQFPFPEQGQRAEIWRHAFPPETPTEGIDVDRLARLRIAGGNIRNIAMNAAFLAADQVAPVRMDHLRAATRSEYAKLERPLTQVEAEAWG